MNPVLPLQLAFISLFLVASCVPEQKAYPDNPFRIEEGQKPWIIAHGGSKALWPENTMMAIDGSMNLGVDALEMDVRLTKDDILVLRHDETIDRMSNGEGKVRDFSFAELQQFNFGHGFENLDGDTPYKNIIVPIAKLEDVFSKYEGTYMNVELKDEGDDGIKAADLLKALIDKYDMQNRVLVASFHDDVMKHYCRETDKSYPMSTAKKETTKMILTTKTATGILYAPEAVATQIPVESSGLNLAKKRIVKSAHRHNMAVHYWTINDKEDMKTLIEMGADGLITDRPDVMMQLLAEMGF